MSLRNLWDLAKVRSMLPRSEEKEWSDSSGVSEKFYAYFKLPNALFLNRRLIYGYLKKFLDREGDNSILDVGCGGDLLQYLAFRLEKDGFRFSMTGVDANAVAVALAKARTKAWRNVRVVCGQAEEVDGSYHVAVVSQVLHHLSPADASYMLKFVYGTVSRGIVISDFVRSRAAYWLVKAGIYLTTNDGVHRHDGPLSVLRSYADEEIGRLMREAGIRSFSIRNVLPRKFIIIPRGREQA
ncbi:MAG: methyltransferase domain-containing protein [Acidobacteriia bacterium]|nr:methyltransferase domain-containing protein [Terriglobia bacterium]